MRGILEMRVQELEAGEGHSGNGCAKNVQKNRVFRKLIIVVIDALFEHYLAIICSICSVCINAFHIVRGKA